MNSRQLISRNLRKLRVDRGVSQERLANEAGLERRYVGGIERDEENPTVATLDKLASVLGVQVSEFLAERGVDPRQIPGLRPGRKPRTALAAAGLGRSGQFSIPRSYTEEQLKAVAKAVGVETARAQECEGDLDLAAVWHRLAENPRAVRARPSELRLALNRVSASAKKLLRNLGVKDAKFADDGPDDDDVVTALCSPGEVDFVLASISQVGRLVEVIDAIKAANSLERRAQKASDEVIDLGDLIVPKGHSAVDPPNVWLERAIPVYERLTGQAAATSVSLKGKASGPLIQFLQAASKPLGIKLSNAAWRERFRRLKKVGEQGT